MAGRIDKTNTQNAATEQANLNEMLKNLKSSAETLETSLSQYITKSYISLTKIPKDIPSLETVLSRFFKENNIKDIYDLVDHKSDKLNDAIDFVKNPVKNTNRAAYDQALRGLKTIKNNLDEYKHFATVSKTKLVEATEAGYVNSKAKTYNLDLKDGFTNYVKAAQIIIKFVNAYDELMEYTDGVALDPEDLPKTLSELHETRLAIAAPNSSSQEDNTNNVKEEEDSDKIEVGGAKYIALINKYARDSGVQDVSQRKHLCYKEAIVHKLAYNKCVNNNEETSENRDLKCAPKQEAFEISKMNCDSHFPMVTINDALVENLLAKVEKVHLITSSDGQMSIDYSSAEEGLHDYVGAQHFLSQNRLEAIAGMEAYDINSDEATSAINSKIGEAAAMIGIAPDQLLIGA